MSADKASYQRRTAERGARVKTNTAYTFCFNAILDWILNDIRTGKIAHRDGLAFVLERGHQNNAEVEACFHGVREQFGLEATLRSIRFASKNECRAIQMADLIAFYSRRHGVAMHRAPAEERAEVPVEPMMRIIAEVIPVRSFVSTDFAFKK